MATQSRSQPHHEPLLGSELPCWQTSTKVSQVWVLLWVNSTDVALPSQ